MRNALRYSSDDGPSTLDRMLSSIPRPSNSGPRPPPTMYHSDIDAAPMPAIPSGPRPLFQPEKQPVWKRLLPKRRSSFFPKSRSGTRPSSPSERNGSIVLPPLPTNEAISLELQRPTLSADEDLHKARLLFKGDESITMKSTAAAWLGGPGDERARVRKAYMKLYSFQNSSILQALRILCNRLYLQGPFSTHWSPPNYSVSMHSCTCRSGRHQWQLRVIFVEID